MSNTKSNEQALPALEELKSLSQWVVWCLLPNEKGKLTKVPYQPRNGYGASTTDNTNWASYEEAIRAFQQRRSSEGTVYAGLGFVFNDDYTGIDLDHCLNEDGTVDQWAKEIIERFKSYREVSQSKTGIHLIVRGVLPQVWNKKKQKWERPGTRQKMSGAPHPEAAIELYCQGRFFVMTGDHVPDAPTAILDCQEQLLELHSEITAPRKQPKNPPPRKSSSAEDMTDTVLIQKAASASNGAKFSALWSGDISGYLSASEADQALCNLLAFWTGRDEQRMDTLFRRSSLYRDKWDRDDYSQRTLRTAIENCAEVYNPQAAPYQSNGHQPPPTGHNETARLCAFSPDDAGNGDALFALYEHEFLYCHERGWMYYDGTCWREDFSECRIRQAATDTLRKRQHAAIDQRKDDVLKCAKPDTSRVTGAIVRFKSLVGIGIDAFDNNPHVINCANGVLDLRTLTLSEHDRHAYRFTYCLAVNLDTSVDLLEWEAFLHATLGDDEEKIEYLQRAVGYSLTGLTREEVLFYLFGPPRAGKGTLSETLMALLGNLLSASVDFNTFTAKREGDTSNFDLAPLKPARMVFASESNRSQSLNPAKIKSCTGGDITRCCYKHKDHFQYRPQYKVWMLSNHPVNGDPEDDALWGRVRVIEFPNSHLGSEDKELKERLKSDEVQQAVLVWAALGAQKWYEHGLTTPQSVLDITRKQRNELDYVQQWLDECQAGDGWTSNEQVMASYKSWCEENNVTPKGMRTLSQSLQAKGFETGHQVKVDGKNTRGVQGLYIKHQTQD